MREQMYRTEFIAIAMVNYTTKLRQLCNSILSLSLHSSSHQRLEKNSTKRLARNASSLFSYIIIKHLYEAKWKQPREIPQL